MIGVLVSGEGTNLQALLREELPVVAVAASSEAVPALARARAREIPTAAFELERFDGRLERDRAMAAWLLERAVELVVLAGFMQILTPTFLEQFPGRAVNVHPSLLPQFPGLRAVERALAAGVSETGATVHLVDEGVDSGRVLAQGRVPIVAGESAHTLHRRIKRVEHRLLPVVVRLLVRDLVPA